MNTSRLPVYSMAVLLLAGCAHGGNGTGSNGGTGIGGPGYVIIGNPVFNQPGVVAPAPVAGGNVVSAFQIFYQFEPIGLRYWQMLQDRLWIELYPDSKFSFFSVNRRDTVDGCAGYVAVKASVASVDLNNEAISYSPNSQPDTTEVFIPDKGCGLMWVRFRNKPTDQWVWLAEMRQVK